MRRFSIPLGLALATLSLLAVVTPAVAEERPFLADGSGGLLFPPSGPVLRGAGEVTHLGRASLRINVDRDEWRENVRVVLRTLILTAANGDLLFADVDADFDFRVTGIYAGTIRFTGGTGRFEDATGGADLLILYEAFRQQFDFALEGTIDY